MLSNERHGNDPSAGSPMETLLRLLLPLNDQLLEVTHCAGHISAKISCAEVTAISCIKCSQVDECGWKSFERNTTWYRYWVSSVCQRGRCLGVGMLQAKGNFSPPLRPADQILWLPVVITPKRTNNNHLRQYACVVTQDDTIILTRLSCESQKPAVRSMSATMPLNPYNIILDWRR